MASLVKHFEESLEKKKKLEVIVIKVNDAAHRPTKVSLCLPFDIVQMQNASLPPQQTPNDSIKSRVTKSFETKGKLSCSYRVTDN